MTVAPAAGLLSLSALRERAAQVLAPASDEDPQVLAAPVDAVDPPALVLSWGDPWVEFETPCFWYAQLAVICFAGRVDPESGTETLEQLVAYTINRFRADAYTWPQQSAQAPRLLEINGLSLLAARVIVRAPVTLNGG